MTNKQSIWRVLGFSVLLMGSVSFIGLALADDEGGSSSGMPHHSGMMGGAGSKGHGMMPGHMSLSPLAMKDELGLKEDQIKAIEPLEMDYRKHGIKSRADVRVAMIDLGSLLDQKNPDRSAISAKVDEISGIRKQMMMYRVDTLLKLKEILTPEQYAQFRSKIKAQMERGMGRRMHGMGGTMGHGKMGEYDRGKSGN
ncbi:MAG: Spy/CpxP family protein refolding chaperone [Nitrospirota bacterium]|nr:MAG: Spy/CpxP family protein refolding chaperone [Nitrospirota bacterium]